jgi:hypothetical protein
MTNIDFFGCSFTQNTNSKFRAARPISIQEYVGHTQITKVQSNFLEFDLAYNENTEYEINNFGRGSYGNFTIGNAIENRIKKLNRTDSNIAIVQLSALLRNEDSLKIVLENNPLLNREIIKYDYITDDLNSMDEFYAIHIKNIENIHKNLSSAYTKYLIYFGWDITTKEFIEAFKQSDVYNKIVTFEYDYDLSEIKYFGNWDNFNNARYKGQYGGLLDYASNHLVEEIRYCSETDQHPSYFSNKLFYKDILRNFIKEETDLNLSKNILDDSVIKEYENFLVGLVAGKYKNGFYRNYSYEELHKSIDYWLLKTKLKKII